MSYSMSPPAVEGCLGYEILKLSRWVEEMEEMDKTLLKRDALNPAVGKRRLVHEHK